MSKVRKLDKELVIYPIRRAIRPNRNLVKSET